MSQSESLMLIALGAALALILVIVFSRGLWEIAVRVMRRRRENEVSPTVIALEAQRDKLRAEHAMMALKMETTVSDIKSKIAEQTAEVSRTRNAMLELQQDLADRDRQLEDRARDLTMMAEKLVEAEALADSRAKALALLDDQMGQKSQEASALRGEIAKLQMEIASLRDTPFAHSVDAGSELSVKGHVLPPTAYQPTAPESTELPVPAPAQSSVREIIEQARKSMQDHEASAISTEPKRTKVLRSTSGGGLRAITERLKSMQRENGA